MQDLNLNEFSASLREVLRDKGVDLPKSLVYQMTKAFFAHAEKTAAAGNKRFLIHNRSLNQVYPNWDVKKLCAELAEGKHVLTADYLIRKNKMQRQALKHYKKMFTTAVVEI